MKRLLIIMFCVAIIFSVDACGGKGEPDTKKTEEKEEMTDTESEKNKLLEETEPLEDVVETEVPKNPDDLEYTACRADELIKEMYDDIDAVAEKYTGKYLEITGILESAEVDHDSTPPGKTVYMKTTVEPPYENGWAIVSAYSWDEEWMTQAEYEEVTKNLSEGDEVVLRGYAEDYSFEDDGGVRLCSLTLVGIRPK